MKQQRTMGQHVLSPGMFNDPKPYKVYILYCPAEKKIRYVGFCTGSPLARYMHHVTEASSCGYMERHKWFTRLKEQGERPYMKVLASFSDKAQAKLHEACLARYMQTKRPLYNRVSHMIHASTLDEYYPAWLQANGLQTT